MSTSGDLDALASGSDTVVVATVHLSDTDETHPTDSNNIPHTEQQKQHEDDDTAGLMVAEPVPTSVIDPEIYGGQSTRNLDNARTRAEYVSATFYKETRDTPIGVNFKPGQMNISSITPNSLGSRSPIKAGDKVYSVNHKIVNRANSTGVWKMIQNAIGYVTIVIHNDGGDSTLVETYLMKPDLKQKVGISFKTDHHDNVLVANIRHGAIASHSLLNSGDIILEMNGTHCVELDPRVAASLISQSMHVTVLARTTHKTANAMAEISERNLMNSSIPFIMSGSNRNNRTSGSTPPPTLEEEILECCCSIL